MLGSVSQWSHTGLTSHPEWHYWMIQWWRSLFAWLLLIQTVKTHQIPELWCCKCAVTHTTSLCPVLRDMHWWSMRHTKRPRQPWKGSTVRTWWASLSALTGDLSEGPPRTRGGEGFCVMVVRLKNYCDTCLCCNLVDMFVLVFWYSFCIIPNFV